MYVVRSSRPKRFPKSAREYRDYDYADALPPEERAWLERFDEEYYGATFTDSPLHDTPDLQRAVYRAKNGRNQDLAGKYTRTESVDTADADKDWTAAPPETPEYRAALSRFRALLPADGRKNAPNSPEFRAAARDLDEIAGVITSRRMEGVTKQNMAKSRLERVKAEHRVVFHLGITVSQHSYTGAQAEAAVEMLKYLEKRMSALDDKLQAMGFDPLSLEYVRQAKGLPPLPRSKDE